MVGHAYPSALTCSWLVLVLRHEVAVTMIICHVGWEVASDVVTYGRCRRGRAHYR